MKKKIALITVLLLLVPFLVSAQIRPAVEVQYDWFAVEKLTVSNSVIQLSSEEYGYYYGSTRINVDGHGGGDLQLNEVISDGTTGAMGILTNYEDANAADWIEIDIKYNGLDSADFDANDTLTGGTSTVTCVVTGTYTRGKAGSLTEIQELPCAIAKIHMLDNSILWTSNGATPVYSATDSACVGKKQYEGDTFYLFGNQEIVNFKSIRNGTSDAIIYIEYGR
jgi:hypothetical protein